MKRYLPTHFFRKLLEQLSWKLRVAGDLLPTRLRKHTLFTAMGVALAMVRSEQGLGLEFM
jgi:hypothetical protein